MRPVTPSSCVLLTVLPATFAQRGQGWLSPSRTLGYGYPPVTPSVTTLATIAPGETPPIQSTIQTGNSPETVQTGEGPATIQTGSSPASVQTGGQPVQTNQNPSTIGAGSTASPTGSSPTTPSSSSNSTDKTAAKGVVYDSGTAQQAISLAPAWACDWDATPDTSGYNFQFVPQLWGPTHTITTSDVASSDYVLFYNEPDNCQGTGGACVGDTQAISDFNSRMKPFQSAGKKVSTPCVMNPSSSYMETFLQGFSKGAMDVLCFHWYGDDLSGLQQTVQTFKSLQQTYQIGELWIGEMGVNSKPSDISQYTQYLDGVVNRYAYNLNFLGSGGTV